MYICRSSTHPLLKVNLKPKQKLIITPIGDVQGDEQIEKLDEFVLWAKDQEKQGNRLFTFGTGDYFETLSPSERVKMAGANFHETTYEQINKDIRLQADDFVRRTKSLEWLCLLSGHHWAPLRIGKGPESRTVPSDQYIAEKLNSIYAGDGLLLISLLINGYRFRIFAAHGIGTGRSKGSRINKRTEMRKILPNANWYVHAHDNEMLIDPEQILIIDDNDEMSYLTQFFTGVGCIQQSYNMHKLEAGYAEKAMYPPAVIGQVMCSIEVGESNRKKYLDYTVIPKPR